MFILPPFPKIAMAYRTIKGKGRLFPVISSAWLLGSRNDQDKESMRLHRAVRRKLDIGGIGSLVQDGPLVAAIQRLHKSRSQFPEHFDALKGQRTQALAHEGVTGIVAPALCGTLIEGFNCRACERIFHAAEEIDGMVFKARHGTTIRADFEKLPWNLLGPTVFPEVTDSPASRAERLLAYDVLAFLWMVSLFADHQGLASDQDVPARAENLGATWFSALQGCARHFSPAGSTSRRGRPPIYRAVAKFLLNGDETGGELETLADKLSDVARGKQMLTSKLLDIQVDMVSAAIITLSNGQPDQISRVEDLTNLFRLHGDVLGLLQHVYVLELPELKRKHNDANFVKGFNAALSCWPKLVNLESTK